MMNSEHLANLVTVCHWM